MSLSALYGLNKNYKKATKYVMPDTASPYKRGSYKLPGLKIYNYICRLNYHVFLLNSAFARMVELVYTYVSEAYASQLASSSLASGTDIKLHNKRCGAFLVLKNRLSLITILQTVFIFSGWHVICVVV